MKDRHVNLRNSGIAVLAPVCMVFIQDGTSAIVQILCKDNRDIGTLVSLLSYITAIILALCLYISNPWIFTTSNDHKHNVIRNMKKNRPEMDSSPKISSILRGFIVFLLILAAGLSLQLFSTGILNIIDFYRPDLMASYKSMVNSSFSLDNGLLRVLTVMFIAPVAEELIFRGISLQSFQRAFTFRHSKPASILASALLFGIFHGNIIQFCYALPAGILLAMLTDWSASLTPAIILHIITNMSSYLVSGYDTASLLLTSQTAYISFVVIAGVLCTVCFILLYILMTHAHSHKTS